MEDFITQHNIRMKEIENKHNIIMKEIENKHNKEMEKHGIMMQDIYKGIPKRKIYYGKVKTE